MSYAAVSDLTARYDVRDVSDLASDTGTAIAAGSLATDPNILAALADASGDIDSALLAGRRYTTDDLTGLTGNSLAKLKRLTCDLAMAFLLGRRPAHDPERLKAFEERGRMLLERLRKGENVFDLDAQKDAGVIDHQVQTIQAVDNMNLLRDQTRHYYPARTFPRLP